MNLQKILLFISKLVLVLVGLSYFGHMVKHTEKGAEFFGLERTLRNFYNLTDEFNMLISPKDERLINIDTDKHINDLQRDVFYLNSRYESFKWHVELKNLKNNDLIKSWTISQVDANTSDRGFSHSGPRLPIILPDSGLLCFLDESKHLLRLDKNSNIVWHKTDEKYHHSMNLGPEGFLWLCGSNKEKGFWDNTIHKVDINTGKTVFTKSVSDMFEKNGKEYMTFGMSNSVDLSGDDPYHLNDIELTKNNTKHWQKGDVFMSFRHRSAVVVYRPSNDSIIHLIQGPFLNQHDIDITSDSTISVFNNNALTFTGQKEVKKITKRDTHSYITKYDFNKQVFTFPFQKEMKKHGLFTQTQGLHHFFEDGSLFVELQNNGQVAFFSPEGTLIYYGVLNNKVPDSDKYERTHWPRLYENSPF